MDVTFSSLGLPRMHDVMTRLLDRLSATGWVLISRRGANASWELVSLQGGVWLVREIGPTPWATGVRLQVFKYW